MSSRGDRPAADSLVLAVLTLNSMPDEPAERRDTTVGS